MNRPAPTHKTKHKGHDESMTSLSQYPASSLDPDDVIARTNIHVSLAVIGLFVNLEERYSNREGTRTAALIPMTLPITCRDASLGVASALSSELRDRDAHLTSEGIIQQSFMLASRDGHAQLTGPSNLPEGIVPDITSLVEGDKDPTLLMQMCNMFSKNTGSLANLKSRPATADDVTDLRKIVANENRKLDSGIESGILSDCPLLRFSDSLYMLQNLIDNGFSYEDLYQAAKSIDSNAYSRYRSSILGQSIEGIIQTSPDGTTREQCHYLALGGMLRKLCPLFLSPVGSAHEVLAEMMLTGGMTPANATTRIPHLRLAPTNHGSQLGVDSNSTKVMVTIYGPKDTSGEGLSEAICYLSQKSLMMQRSVGTKSAVLESTHR